MGGRWTAARRRMLEDSRITVTEDLVRAIAAAKTRPRVLSSPYQGLGAGRVCSRADGWKKTLLLAAKGSDRGAILARWRARGKHLS